MYSQTAVPIQPKTSQILPKLARILLTDQVASPGSIVTAGKPGKKTKTSFLQYEVCTLGGQEGDIGVLPPLGIWDPLGLIETKDMRRWVIIYLFSNSQLERIFSNFQLFPTFSKTIF